MDFDKDPIEIGVARLREKGTVFEDGLTDAEIKSIESRFQFTFPSDVRFFLQLGMPSSSYFVNWRGDPSEVRDWIDELRGGVLFDVSHNSFWDQAWGERPELTPQALELARNELVKAPKLIPIGDQIFTKCVPATPCIAGNPVFSIHQTDALHAGRDIGDYLLWLSRPAEMFRRDDEEGTSPTPLFGEDYRYIPFWTDMARGNTSN